MFRVVRVSLLLWCGCWLVHSAPVRAADTPSDEATEDVISGDELRISAALQEEFALRATAEFHKIAETANSDGFGGGKLDLAKRFFVALDLGAVEDDNGQITFNFNPRWGEELVKKGMLSSKVVVRKSQLYAPVVEGIQTLPEGERADAAKALEGGLDDLDDVEVAILWSSKKPETSELSVARVARQIVKNSITIAHRERQSRDDAQLQSSSRPTFQESAPFESSADSREAARQAIREADPKDVQIVALGEAMDARLIETLPMLEDNDSVGSVALSYRRRVGAAGPDVAAASVRYEYGIKSLKGFCEGSCEGGSRLRTAGDLMRYLDGKPAWAERQPRLTFIGEWSRTRNYSFVVPGTELDISLPTDDIYSAKLIYGQVLSINHRTRFDLEAKYDQTDDERRQSRFVATATWTQALNKTVEKLAGGSSLAVSLVWANRPEFRGEVNKELSLLAGLKWSVDKGKEDS